MMGISMSLQIVRSAAFAAAILFAPTASFAQETFGTITASINGQARTWFLTTQDNESQSFGFMFSAANLQSFSLWGQPTDETVTSLKDTLLFTFDVMSVGDQLIPLETTLTYLENGWTSGWHASKSSEPATMDFSLTTFEKSDDGIFVEGTFEAATGFREPLSSGEIDLSRTLQMNGTFSATLPPFLFEEK
jgi:hypothetical protein